MQQNRGVVSIRLASNGDSFVMPESMPQSCGVDDAPIRLEIVTKKAILIPAEVLMGDDEGSVSPIDIAQEQLAIAGVVIGGDEQFIQIGSDDIVALVVVPKLLMSELMGRYQGNVDIETPLLRRRVNGKKHMLVDSFEGITTVKVFSQNELMFADVYETPSVASATYWLQTLASVMKMRDAALYIYRGDAALRRLLRPYFKQISVCE
ncbi:MAG: hypothetical protein R3Y70_04030 [Rikenellaceae bacterium]